jgi:uncharacterized protein (DUF2249 family)
MNDTELIIDVRAMLPRQRHPAIFTAWNELSDGEAIVLVNDHDPLPLYYQFACESSGRFRWEYLEQGPKAWRVRISKGRFADPGFEPPRRALTPQTPARPVSFAEPLVVDTRPIFGRGETPCAAIDEAVASLIPGQKLVLLVPFEPAPLYQKLAQAAFTHHARVLDDGAWQVEFRR